MNLMNAFQKCNKIKGSEVKKSGDVFWFINDDGAIQDDCGAFKYMTKDRLLADDYEPYEPQIVPKEAGEVWTNKDMSYYIYAPPDNTGPFRINARGSVQPIEECKYMVHGQNDWKRLRPEVPDPNIEMVVIDGVSSIPVNLLNALRLMDERGRSSIRASRALFESEWGELRQLIFNSLEMSENVRDTMNSKSTGTSHE